MKKHRIELLSIDVQITYNQNDHTAYPYIESK